MDFNWLFSSVAQSAAAIVGIFAAFIITKIINNQTAFNQNNVQIKELLNDAHKLEDATERRYFEWYNKHTLNAAIKKLKEELKDPANALLSADEYYKKFKFPVFIEKQKILKVIEIHINNQKKGLNENAKSFPGMPYEIPIIIPAIPDIGLSKALTEEKDIINEMIDEIKHHNRKIKTLVESIRTNPESSRLILYSIIASIILFYIGVIYPLSFLPLETGREIQLSLLSFFVIIFSIQGVILSAISVVFTAVLVTFLNTNQKMIYQKDDIEKLEFYSKLENYCAYLKIMVSNLEKKE